jgi:hypothetical protein
LYAVKESIPFSYNYTFRDINRKSEGLTPQIPTKASLLGIVGFTPAPRDIGKVAYERATEERIPHYSSGKKPAFFKTEDLKADIERAMTVQDDKEFNRLANKGLKEGVITERDLLNLQKQQQVIPRVRKFYKLNLEDGLAVYNYYVQSNQNIPREEKDQLLDSLAKKIIRHWPRIARLPKHDPTRERIEGLMVKLNAMDQSGALLPVDVKDIIDTGDEGGSDMEVEAEDFR